MNMALLFEKEGDIPKANQLFLNAYHINCRNTLIQANYKAFRKRNNITTVHTKSMNK